MYDFTFSNVYNGLIVKTWSHLNVVAKNYYSIKECSFSWVSPCSWTSSIYRRCDNLLLFCIL